MLQLTRARNRLTTPASMTLPELATSGLMVRSSRLETTKLLSQSSQEQNLSVLDGELKQPIITDLNAKESRCKNVY